VSASDDVMKVAREIALRSASHVRNNADAQAVENIVTKLVAAAILADRASHDVEIKALRAALDRKVNEKIEVVKALKVAEAEVSRLTKRVEEAAELRGDWHGVFLDGRNEHGAHVLMLPQRSIDLEQDSSGDFLKDDAETILREAEAKGFKVGDAVVVTFDLCLDDGFFSHYEFVDVSLTLTALFYGSPEEQDADRGRRARDFLQKNGGGNG
jgi:hypothetical protein